MKVESMQTINSSYQSQGSAKVAVQSVSAKSGAETGSDINLQSKSAEPLEFQEDGTARTGAVREEGQASNEQIRQAVEKINRNAHNEEAVFGIHDATNRVTIKIIDKETKEVIKEFPPEKTLDMIAKVWEMAGIMVDERR